MNKKIYPHIYVSDIEFVDETFGRSFYGLSAGELGNKELKTIYFPFENLFPSAPYRKICGRMGNIGFLEKNHFG